MVKVLAACGNGMGSSMVIKMKVENALRKLNQKDFTVKGGRYEFKTSFN